MNLLHSIETEYFEEHLVRIVRETMQSRNIYQVEKIDASSGITIKDSNFVTSWDRIADRVRAETGFTAEGKKIIMWILRHEIIDVRRRMAMAESQMFQLEEIVQENFAVKEVLNAG